MGNKSERLVHLTLQLFSNPKGDSAYKYFFDMLNENKFVIEGTISIQVTPAQQKLLKLLTPIESETYADSLRKVHELGTYTVDVDEVDLSASYHTHVLLDLIRSISIEYYFNKNKTA